MNKEQPIRDQAERLRQRISKINEGKEESIAQSLTTDRDAWEYGSLPPRSAVHGSKKKKKKSKMKYPVIRFLVIFFLLLPLIIYGTYAWKQSGRDSGSQSLNGSGNVETVDLDEKESGDGEKSSPTDEKEDGAEKEEDSAKEDRGTKDEIAGTAKENVHTAGTTPGIQTLDDKSTGTGNGSSEKIIYHQVQPNETLYSIAMKYFKNRSGIDIIKQANGLENDRILAGQTLKIPLQ